MPATAVEVGPAAGGGRSLAHTRAVVAGCIPAERGWDTRHAAVGIQGKGCCCTVGGRVVPGWKGRDQTGEGVVVEAVVVGRGVVGRLKDKKNLFHFPEMLKKKDKLSVDHIPNMLHRKE